jgi:hypothetical protein
MNDWDRLINERFAGKNDTLKILAETIDEVMSELSDLRTPVNEDMRPASTSTEDCEIPEIPLTEIGWGKFETAEGTEVSGPQRTLLEDYLKNIAPSGDLATKIKALDSFYVNGFAQIETESKTQMISRVLSFLVFYKTLTRVITNFNAASAGFTFEAFLGTLLQGTQIPPGSNTIADLKTADGVPISLKLYAEKTVAVGGSFTDLVRDLTDSKFPGYEGMKYVVCAKGLSGRPGKQEGYIKFYEFDFTLDNVANIIAGASRVHTAANFILPLVDDGTGKYVLIPDASDLEEPIAFSDEEINEKMREILFGDEVWEGSGLEDYQIQNIINSPVASYKIEGESLDLTSTAPRRFSLTTANKNKLTPLLADPKADPTPTVAYATIKKAIDALNSALDAILGKEKEINARRQTGVAALGAQGIFPKVPKGMRKDNKQVENVRALAARSRDWYNEQDEETKRRALRYTMGYLKTEQFELNREESTSAGLAPVRSLGAINIGSTHIEAVLQNCRSLLNENICSIFGALKELTTNLNDYFANGLDDDSKAEKAIVAADDIETRTKEVVVDKGESTN